MLDKKIGIIGCGNMGEALLSRLATAMEKSTSLMVSEQDEPRREYIQSKYRIIVEMDNSRLVNFSDVVIIAVKPKDFDDLLKELCCSFSKDKLLISIAAGVTTRHIEDTVGKDIPVIRAMPNMPALIGEAVSSISAGSSAGAKDIRIAKDIFSFIGDVVDVDEKLVDAVTAVSGSGPAYFFHLIEVLIEAARDMGLDRKTAHKLVLKTALGSAKLLEHLKEDPAVLRGKVTSKGGTTEAAFRVFESRKFRDIVKEAVKEACKRSKELSKG